MEQNVEDQVEDYWPSIEHILRPITYMSWLMGVGIARPRKYPKAVTIIIRVVYLLIYCMNLMFLINIKSAISCFISKNNEFNYKVTLMIIIVTVSNYASACYYTYSGISQYNKWPELMKKMKVLDQNIRRQISMNNQPPKNRDMIIMLAFVVFSLVLCIVIFLYFCLIYSVFLFFAIWGWMYIYMILQWILNNMVLFNVVDILRHRFKTINRLIGLLDTLQDAQEIVRQIRRIRELHKCNYELAIMINDIHGVYLLIWPINCFCNVVITLSATYGSFKQGLYILITIECLLCIEYVIQFGFMCWDCTYTSEECQRTGTLINGFEENFEYTDCIRNEINNFSIQLQHHRIAFTACNCFEINNTLFIGFVGAIITYLVIFIQFIY